MHFEKWGEGTPLDARQLQIQRSKIKATLTEAMTPTHPISLSPPPEKSRGKTNISAAVWKLYILINRAIIIINMLNSGEKA